MEMQRGFGFVLVVMVMVVGSVSFVCEAYEFHVGGQSGWVARSCEDYYNHWAERTRFQVNDTLVFKYKKGSDSVHVVKKEDYNTCNTNNSSLSLTDGESTFKFDRSGAFFFISGNANSCKKGQRLIVVVMAVRCKPPPPPPALPPPNPADAPRVSPPPALPPSRGVVINTTSYTDAPTPAPNGSGKTSVGLVLSVVCVGVMSVVFW